VNHCMRHFEEPIAGTCASCCHPFCRRCLVYAFGPKKPAYCVGCALAEAGVRQGARGRATTVVPPDRKLVKAERRAQRDALKLERKQAKTLAKAAPTEPMYETSPPSSTVPAPSSMGVVANAHPV